MNEIQQKLITWIKEKVEKAGAKGAVVGLSGGVDSSVVAVLCKKAFPKNTLGLIMPCQSKESDIQDAKKIATKFKIPYKIVSLDEVYNSLVHQLLESKLHSQPNKIALGNIKPRLRMITLYYFANLLNYLVVGTGNKSELTLGYFTKYGDGGVDLLPLGNLVKTEVKKLAKKLGIPEEIIKKTPSAGLWEGQTDEGELGFTYEKLDRFLLTGKASPELVSTIKQMEKGSSHKRKPPLIPPF